MMHNIRIIRALLTATVISLINGGIAHAQHALDTIPAQQVTQSSQRYNQCQGSVGTVDLYLDEDNDNDGRDDLYFYPNHNFKLDRTAGSSQPYDAVQIVRLQGSSPTIPSTSANNSRFEYYIPESNMIFQVNQSGNVGSLGNYSFYRASWVSPLSNWIRAIDSSPTKIVLERPSTNNASNNKVTFRYVVKYKYATSWYSPYTTSSYRYNDVQSRSDHSSLSSSNFVNRSSNRRRNWSSIQTDIGCRDYTLNRCGDGTVDKKTFAFNIQANEFCDDGNNNSDTTPGACKTDCSGYVPQVANPSCDGFSANPNPVTVDDTTTLACSGSNNTQYVIQGLNQSNQQVFLQNFLTPLSSVTTTRTPNTAGTYDFYCHVQKTANNVDTCKITLNVKPKNKPNVTITKDLTGTTAAYAPGDIVTFEINFSNNGSGIANNVKITDIFPDTLALTGTPQVTVNSTYNFSTKIINGRLFVYFTGITLQPGQSGTIIVKGKLRPMQCTTNNTYNYVNITEPQGSSDVGLANFACEPFRPDLWIDKETNNQPRRSGDIVTFTINFANSGSMDATGVTIRDILPMSLQYVNSSISVRGFTLTTGVDSSGFAYMEYNTRSLAAGTTGHIILHAKVIAEQCGNSTRNTVYIKDRFADPYLIQEDIVAGRQGGQNYYHNPQLSIPKTTFENQLIQRYNDFLQKTQQGGTYILTAMPAGSIQSLSAGNWYIDFADYNCAATVDITKTQGTGGKYTSGLMMVQSGDTVYYKIDIVNRRGAPISNMIFQDILPDHMQYISGSTTKPGVVLNTLQNKTFIVSSQFSLQTGESLTVYITAKILKESTDRLYENTAIVQTNQDTRKDTVTAYLPGKQPILWLAKDEINPSNHLPGDTVTFKLIFGNTGFAVATGIIIEDMLPPTLTYVSSTISGANGTRSVSNNGTLIKYNNITLQPGQKAEIILTTKVSNLICTNTTNTAKLTWNNVIKLGAKTFFCAAKPSIDKLQRNGQQYTNNVVTKNLGDTLRYKLVIHNNGNDGTSDAFVKDYLPAGIQYVSHTTTQPNINFTTGIDNTGTYLLFSGFDLAANEKADIEITTSVMDVTNTQCTNIATVVFTQPHKTATDQISCIKHVDTQVTLTKSVDKLEVYPNDLVTFTVRFTNNGPSPITDISFTDNRPRCISFNQRMSNSTTILQSQSTNPYQRTMPNTTLNAGETITLTLRGNAQNNSSCYGIHTNTVTAEYTVGNQQKSVKDQAHVHIKIPAIPGVKLTKTADKSAVQPGDTITFTIRFTNDGNIPLDSFTVTDIWPKNTLALNGIAVKVDNQGTGDPVYTRTEQANSSLLERVFTNTPLAPDQSGTITLQATVR